MSFGGGGGSSNQDQDSDEAKLEAEKDAENKKLMLQRIAAMRRLRSGGGVTATTDKQTLG